MKKIDKEIAAILRRPYSRVLMPAEEGGFSARIAEFPGCFAEGKTTEEAYGALERAADGWLHAALSRGLKIPEPASVEEPSGRLLLRLPRSLHRDLQETAAREGVSLNTWIIRALSGETRAAEVTSRIEAAAARLSDVARQQRHATAALSEAVNTASATWAAVLPDTKAPGTAMTGTKPRFMLISGGIR